MVKFVIYFDYTDLNKQSGCLVSMWSDQTMICGCSYEKCISSVHRNAKTTENFLKLAIVYSVDVKTLV